MMNVDKCFLPSCALSASLCTGMLMGHSHERGKEVEVINVENKREQKMPVCGDEYEFQCYVQSQAWGCSLFNRLCRNKVFAYGCNDGDTDTF